ncbi:hypothetical protein AB0I53_12395 [Saccharopolyspora sp. NPDC050389]|uniref:hypothetical protein n=1 Tax=Saccharopolyspora sp. NPDC050389 TaxID=3155516 RepID=UPI0033C552B7
MAELYFDPGTLGEDGSSAWTNALAGEERDPNHLVHIVRDLEPVDALELLGGLPRTLDELRRIPMQIAPLDSRPYLFQQAVRAERRIWAPAA